ncbi:MAG: hypothetical protein JXJ04_07630 [Spirochaetales bacterium]|nr:hypothetical protein [Spirochaetales bacterium]
MRIHGRLLSTIISVIIILLLSIVHIIVMMILKDYIDKINTFFRIIEQKKSSEVAINFYNDAIKQYKNADELMLEYLCYFYMEEIYNKRKREILNPGDPE